MKTNKEIITVSIIFGLWLATVIAVIIWLLILSGCLIILLGCGGGGSSSDSPPTAQATQTLYLYNQTLTDQSQIDSTLNSWISQRTKEWEGANNISAPSFSLNIIDSWGFKCRVSDTGWCAGMTTGRTISAPIYHRFDFYTLPTDLTHYAPHTLISSDEIYLQTGNPVWKSVGKWYVGGIPETGIGFPVITHELDHLAGKNVLSVEQAGGPVPSLP